MNFACVKTSAGTISVPIHNDNKSAAGARLLHLLQNAQLAGDGGMEFYEEEREVVEKNPPTRNGKRIPHLRNGRTSN